MNRRFTAHGVNPKVTISTDLTDLEDALARWGSHLPNPVREKQDEHVLQQPERRPWGKPVNYLGGPEFARWEES